LTFTYKSAKEGSYSETKIKLNDWPEIVNIHDKLMKGESLNTLDKDWINELSKEIGWSAEDTMDEIKNLDKEPSSQIERYRQLFEKYYNEALKLKEKKDYVQSGEKLWGSVTALIKLYAAKKNIFVSHWSHGDLHQFVKKYADTNPVKLPDGSTIIPREVLRTLLRETESLHSNFYDNFMTDEDFEDVFKIVVELIEKAKELVELK